MPYCPRCGVQVDVNRKNCPLCSFPIPEVKPLEDDSNYNREEHLQNLYRIKKEENRRRWREARVFVYAGISFSLLIVSLMFGIQDFYFSGDLSWSRYAILSNITVIILLFFILRFIPYFLPNFAGIWITTGIFLFSLDYLNGDITWFFDPGLIIYLNTMIWILLLRVIIRRSRRGINIPAYIFIASGLGCLSLEIVHSFYTNIPINLSWSIPVATTSIPIGIILLFLHFLLSPKFRDIISRKFHL